MFAKCIKSTIFTHFADFFLACDDSLASVALRFFDSLPLPLAAKAFSLSALGLYAQWINLKCAPVGEPSSLNNLDLPAWMSFSIFASRSLRTISQLFESSFFGYNVRRNSYRPFAWSLYAFRNSIAALSSDAATVRTMSTGKYALFCWPRPSRSNSSRKFSNILTPALIDLSLSSFFVACRTRFELPMRPLIASFW